MNYRHIYHAGNFADVVKHVALSRLVEYLKLKDKAFRVIDTHAGLGLYDLSSPEAQKTGEWRDGIGRLLAGKLPAAAQSLLQPYLDAVGSANPQGGLERYPGSPLIVRHLLRQRDRLTAIELHPQDFLRLKARFAGDFQVRVIDIDGWLALGAHLPPKEKRGLVLVDPPFEQAGEFERLVEGLQRAHRRWPGGIFALWYPIKDRAAVARFRDGLRAAGIPKILDIAFEVRQPSSDERFDGSGLVVVNPPFVFEGEMRALLPELKRALAQDRTARWSLEWLAGEDAPLDRDHA
ncbi:MAG: 23S rRNA (adenine(2030)-N(6))-methyltransferase RlmJ [Hyphomicrobiales bacterium]|nr:23S rRNA (adenine(2030)-N(6))-methyltransferase RlmJ [Hyphomicrobiales bacterium]